MASFVLGKVYENSTKIMETFYFMKHTSKRVISTRNYLFVEDKIITKFGQKKLASLVLGKVYKNSMKIKEKCYFMKLTSKRVISTRNHFLVLR